MDKIEQTKEDKLEEIKNSIDSDSLFFVPKERAEEFEKKSKEEGKGIIAIMTYGDKIVYLKADDSTLPKIDLSKFNYTSGTFEKKWGQDHKTIILTPNHSSVRKVEIEIQGMNIHKMKLLPGKTGDVFEDVARVKITRHYRFLEGDSENKGDSVSASPGETSAN
jgi:hypothetical protein